MKAPCLSLAAEFEESFQNNQISAKTEVCNENTMWEPQTSHLSAVPFSALPTAFQHSLLWQAAASPLNQRSLQMHFSILLRQEHGMCSFFSQNLPHTQYSVQRFALGGMLHASQGSGTDLTWYLPAHLLAHTN